jgi:hypothetical protein
MEIGNGVTRWYHAMLKRMHRPVFQSICIAQYLSWLGCYIASSCVFRGCSVCPEGHQPAPCTFAAERVVLSGASFVYQSLLCLVTLLLCSEAASCCSRLVGTNKGETLNLGDTNVQLQGCFLSMLTLQRGLATYFDLRSMLLSLKWIQTAAAAWLLFYHPPMVIGGGICCHP